MNGLFCGNSCTWSLIIVIVFLLAQGWNNDGCGCSAPRGGCGCNKGCGNDDYGYQYTGGCGCGNTCGCN